MTANAKQTVGRGSLPAMIRPAVVVAATGSFIAGVIHAIAAVDHSEGWTMVWLFGLCAVAQIGWAAIVVYRPTPPVLAAGLVLNGLAVAFWLWSRTTGVPFINELNAAEEVGSQDLAAALCALASATAAVVVLIRPVAKPTLPAAWSLLGAAAALILFAPVLASGHAHTPAHDHEQLAAGAAHEHAGGGVEATAHEHDATSAAHDETHPAGTEHDEHSDAAAEGEHEDGHGHNDGTSSDATSEHGHDGSLVAVEHEHGSETSDAGHGDSHDPTDPGHDPTDPGHDPTDPGHDPTDPGHDPTDPGHDPTGPIISLDDPRVTPEQRAAAIQLIQLTAVGMAPFTTIEAVEAAGYRSIGDGGVDGYEHYVNWSYLVDGREMDPSHIESIVAKKSATGPKTVVSALYILNVGTTMDDVPDIAGELTPWHIHDNLCFEGQDLVAVTDPDGSCPRGSLLVTPPMMHVWMVESPCGPFAGIDEQGVQCEGHDH